MRCNVREGEFERCGDNTELDLMCVEHGLGKVVVSDGFDSECNDIEYLEILPLNREWVPNSIRLQNACLLSNVLLYNIILLLLHHLGSGNDVSEGA